MTYAFGSITSATPTTALVTILEDALTGHASWEFVEQHVDGAYTNRIWKNKGSANSFGQDFYVAIMRLTSGIGTTPIIFKAAEGYSTSTHLATRGCAQGNYVPDATYASAFGTTAQPFSASAIYLSPTSTITSSFTYQILVTKNGITLGTSPTLIPIYAGLFDSLWAARFPVQEFPLMCGSIPSSNGTVATSRQPGYVGTATVFYIITNSTHEIGTGIIGVPNPLYGYDALGSRLRCTFHDRGALLRGFVYDTLQFGTTVNPVVGDTIVVSGAVWAIAVDNGITCVFIDTEAP